MLGLMSSRFAAHGPNAAKTAEDCVNLFLLPNITSSEVVDRSESGVHQSTAVFTGLVAWW